MQMQSLVVLLALVGLPVVQARPVADQPEPAFCHGLECPYFKTVNKTDEFELRCYETDYKWASTIVAGYTYKKAVEIGFLRLFRYIQGDNVKKLKIAMTVPVAVEIQAGQGPFCKNNFTVNFFVPFKYQNNPVEPTSQSGVFISSLKKFCAYVKSYGGFSNITLVQENTEKLSEALVKAGLGDTFIKNVFFSAGYDSMFRLFDRHNEIWLIKKDSVDKTVSF